METETIEYNAVLFFVALYIKDNGKYNKEIYSKAADMLHKHFGNRFLIPHYSLPKNCPQQDIHNCIISDLAKRIYVGLWEIR